MKQQQPQYAFLGSIIGGIGGYLGAKKQADAANQQNALNAEQYAWEREKYQPIVEGAQHELGYKEQFAPYTQGSQDTAAQSLGVGQNYLSGTQPFYEAGQEGAHALRNLAQQSGAEGTLGVAQQYFNPFVQQQQQVAAQAINNEADRARRDAAIRSAGRGASLSDQSARIIGQIEGQRQSNLASSAQNLYGQAYNNALQQARAQQQYQQGLGSALVGLGTTGLNQATTAAQLGQGAATAGVSAPFAPFNAYSQAIQGTTVNPYKVESGPSALGAGIGAGLQAYEAFKQ